MVFRFFLRVSIRLLTLSLVIVLLIRAVEAVLPKQGILLFSTPVDFAPPNPTFRNEVEWQVRLFDVRTGFWLPVYRYRKTTFASAFHWAPDGKHIAGEPMNVGTVVVDVSRKNASYTVKGFALAWSHTGHQFATMLSQNGNYHAYIGAADGSDLHRLDTPLKNNMWPTWSADDRQIAVSDEKTFSIYRINVSGGQAQQLTSAGSNLDWDRNPVWSPDNKSIAYLQSRAGSITLVILDADQGTVQLSYANSNLLIGRSFWSPDSRYITFVATNRATNVDDLYILDTRDGGSVRKLVDNVYYVYDVPWEMWSPDGRYIAFSHSTLTANKQPVPAAELNIIEVATGSITKIADVAAAYPLWMP